MPARKKKKPSAKDKADAIKAVRKDSFEKNELVFAFVSGHPHWPATVERFNEEPFDYFALFFGTFERARRKIVPVRRKPQKVRRALQKDRAEKDEAVREER